MKNFVFVWTIVWRRLKPKKVTRNIVASWHVTFLVDFHWQMIFLTGPFCIFVTWNLVIFFQKNGQPYCQDLRGFFLMSIFIAEIRWGFFWYFEQKFTILLVFVTIIHYNAGHKNLFLNPKIVYNGIQKINKKGLLYNVFLIIKTDCWWFVAQNTT